MKRATVSNDVLPDNFFIIKIELTDDFHEKHKVPDPFINILVNGHEGFHSVESGFGPNMFTSFNNADFVKAYDNALLQLINQDDCYYSDGSDGSDD